MKNSLKIELNVLPKRETLLAIEDIKGIFGGCKDSLEDCLYGGDCCSGFCVNNDFNQYGLCAKSVQY